MNLFWKYRGNDRFPKEILDYVFEKKWVDFCIIETKRIDDDYIANHKNVYAINNNIGFTLSYDSVVDENEQIALNDELIEKMLPYESLAIQLGIRRNNIPNTVYEEERMNYMRSLRFWHHMFITYNINAAFFLMVPHNQHDYVIYGLAKALNIPIIVCGPTHLSSEYGYWRSMTWGYDIESIGKCIENEYKKCENLDDSSIVLTGKIKEYYDCLADKTLDEIKKTKNPGVDEDTKNLEKYWSSKRFSNHRIGIYKLFISWFRMTMSICINGRHSTKSMEKESAYIHMVNDRFYYRHFAESKEEYNSLAQYPDYEKKYIYYSMSYFPEEAIIPRSRVLYDQYQSIQLLARIASEFGLMVYVKEHPFLSYRDKRVYGVLRKIDNVLLIKSDLPTYDIIQNCVAVATIKGACVLESVLLGKPVLVFDEAYTFHGMPGVFRLYDESSGKEVVRRILSGCTINQCDVKRYFYAIQKCLMFFENEVPEDKTTVKYNQFLIDQILVLFEKLYKKTKVARL